jgi:hypothetical protein
MRAVTGTRTFVVVGSRPASRAADLFADIRTGGEAFLFALGLRPTPAQRLMVSEALEIAAARRFVLTAESIGDADALRDRLRDAGTVRVEATRSERRRWDLGAVSARVAR